MDQKKKQALVTAAQNVRKRAYAPYSNYEVGASLLTKDGSIVTGCNVENAVWGLTICAERSAIFTAVSQGHREFTAMAVVTKDGGPPCGACRQAIREFCTDMDIIFVDEHGIAKDHTLKEIFPHSFGPENIQSLSKK